MYLGILMKPTTGNITDIIKRVCRIWGDPGHLVKAYPGHKEINCQRVGRRYYAKGWLGASTKRTVKIQPLHWFRQVLSLVAFTQIAFHVLQKYLRYFQVDRSWLPGVFSFAARLARLDPPAASRSGSSSVWAPTVASGRALRHCHQDGRPATVSWPDLLQTQVGGIKRLKGVTPLSCLKYSPYWLPCHMFGVCERGKENASKSSC